MVNAGLILEGGGMRGVYTAGVLDALMGANLYFKAVYGVSAGACHATSYLSRQRGRAYRTVADFVHLRRYASVHTLLRTGDYFNVDMIYREIPDELLPFDYHTFAAARETFYAVLTDCRTGAPVYRAVEDLRRRQDMDTVRASSSLPLLSRTVYIDGVPCLDGGIADSIPLARSMADRNPRHLVVLTRHRGYRKGPNHMMPLLAARYRAYPTLVARMRDRHLRYNEALDLVARQEAQGEVFLLQPAQPVEIGRLEKDTAKLRALYRQGLDDAERALPALREFFCADGLPASG